MASRFAVFIVGTVLFSNIASSAPQRAGAHSQERDESARAELPIDLEREAKARAIEKAIAAHPSNENQSPIPGSYFGFCYVREVKKGRTTPNATDKDLDIPDDEFAEWTRIPVELEIKDESESVGSDNNFNILQEGGKTTMIMSSILYGQQVQYDKESKTWGRKNSSDTTKRYSPNGPPTRMVEKEDTEMAFWRSDKGNDVLLLKMLAEKEQYSQNVFKNNEMERIIHTKAYRRCELNRRK